MTLRTAVIGVGALGRHHARILSQLPGSELVAVVDSSPEQGRSVAEACGTTWYRDCDEIVDSVDAVSVVVPTIAHLNVARPFLERGVSVLVEKPIAASLFEAKLMLRLARKNDCVLQVGHIERFNPAMIAARKSITIPKYIRAERVSPYTFRSTDIGVVLDLMIHDIDLVLSLVDSPIEGIEAFGASVFGEHEDVAQARLRFRNGCIADLTASRVNPQPQRTMQVWHEDGCTNIDFGSREVTSFARSNALRRGDHYQSRPQTIEERNQLMKSVFGKLINVEQVEVEDGDALTAELTEFIDCATNGQQPTVSGVEGMQAIEAADLVLNSVATHCWDGTPAGRVGPMFTPPRLKIA